MASRTPKQISHGLITYYSNEYSNKFGYSPSFSRYAVSWGMIDLLSDYSPDEIKELLDYFLKCERKSYSLEHFYASIHKVKEGMEESKRRRAEREKLLKQTQKAVESFERRS